MEREFYRIVVHDEFTEKSGIDKSKINLAIPERKQMFMDNNYFENYAAAKRFLDSLMYLNVEDDENGNEIWCEELLWAPLYVVRWYEIELVTINVMY